MKNNNNKKSAFSLLETIVVLAVVTIGLLSIMTLMTNSLKAQTLNRNTLVAYNLAQEGLELIRNVRDTNWRSGLTWNQGFVGTPAGLNYKVDYLHFTPMAVNDISEARLQIASSTAYYLHDENSSNSVFSRLITVKAATTTAPSSSVTALIEWNEQGQKRHFELTTELYDWK